MAESVDITTVKQTNVCPRNHVKGKGSPYSITERRVPELIPLLGSQPVGDDDRLTAFDPGQPG